MKSFTKILLSLLCISFFTTSVVAQTEPVFEDEEEMNFALEDSSYLKKKNLNQQWDYENYMNEFPAKKKSKWAFGVSGGFLTVTGDVKPDVGWAAGMTLQKGIGHVFSLRLQSLFGRAYGRDWRASMDMANPSQSYYRNYRTTVSDHTIQGVVALNNINFYKKNPKMVFYGFAGGGFSTRFTQIDSLNFNAGNSPYGYDQLLTPAVDRSEKRRILTTLRDETDKIYETVLPVDPFDVNVQSTKIMPTITWGMGVTFNMGKVMDMSFEHKMSWHNDDYLDAYAADRNLQATSTKDFMHYSSVALLFKIGKRTQPLWWVNPVEKPYKEIMDLRQTIDNGDFMKDGDDDGVLDIVDKEKNTPPNVAVTSKGVTLDSDKDGIPDHLDSQPYTPVGSPIDKNGVALDTDKDGVPDVFDKEAGSPDGALVDAKGYEITGVGGTDGPTGFNVKNATEIIFFDLNKTDIKPEFYHILFKIKDFMEENPDKKVAVEGHTDNRAGQAYNDALAKKRAQAVVDALTSRFNLSPDRFVIISKGEDAPLVPNLPANYSDKSAEGQHYLNRRVVLHVVK